MPAPHFITTGPLRPGLPVLLSVPHAGRDYAGWSANLRVPLSAVRPLEDRFADALAGQAAAAGFATIIATAPRLAIDLNRAPDDLDPALLDEGVRGGPPPSARSRAGLGLIPSRLADVGPLWRRPFSRDAVRERVRDVHEPYHEAVAHMLATMRRACGAALLLDIHSMPPLGGPDAADIVIGDRFGTTAAPALTDTAQAVLTGLGFRTACNVPYSGGYVVSRHAAPLGNIHAIQIEVDRQIYLDARLDLPGDGLDRVQSAILALARALSAELAPCQRQAAE